MSNLATHLTKLESVIVSTLRRPASLCDKSCCALSTSVADAIRFCREDLQMPEYQGSEATEEFVRIFDALYEVVNQLVIAMYLKILHCL